MSRGGIQYKGLGDAMVQTVRSEGFRGLYRGLGVAFMGSAPAACLYFTSYEVRPEPHRGATGPRDDMACTVVQATHGGRRARRA